MSKLHYVKRSNKAYPKAGIKKGMPYYWWNTARQGKNRGTRIKSLTKPRRSQLVKSLYMRAMYDMEDEFNAIDAGDPETVKDDLVSVSNGMEELMEDIDQKLSSMQDVFRNGCPTIDLLEERKEACRTIYDSLQSAIDMIDNDGDVQDALSLVEWTY